MSTRATVANGRLPAGLHAQLLHRAMVPTANQHRRLVPPWLHRLLDASDPDKLWRELSKPNRREQLEQTERLRLSQALYQFAKLRSPPTYQRFVAPAEEHRNNKVYLNPAVFAELIRTHRDLLETGSVVSPNGSTESLLLMGYGYALLQKSVAEIVLAPLRELGPGPQAWLDVSSHPEHATAFQDDLPAGVPGANAHSRTADESLVGRSTPRSDSSTETSRPAKPEPSSDPAFDDPTDSSGTLLESLRPLLTGLVTAHGQLERAVVDQEFDGVREHLARGEAVRAELTWELRRLGETVGVTLPEPAKIRTESEAALYLARVSAAYRAGAVAQRESALMEARQAFDAEGEALPPDIADSPTAAEVRLRLEAHRPRLCEARFARLVHTGARIPSEVRDAVTPSRRLEIYRAAAMSLDAKHLLRVLLEDEAGLVSDTTGRGFDAVLTSLRRELARGAALPPGMWSLAQRLDPSRLSSGLETLLPSNHDLDPQRSAIGELAQLLGREALPDRLRTALRLAELEGLDPDHRAREVARLAAAHPSDGMTAARLCETLLACGRYGEAWLVMDAYARQNVDVPRPAGWRDAMREMLLDRALAREAPTSLLEQVLEWRYWVEDDADLTVFAVIALRVGRGRDILYYFPQLTAVLEARRPELMRTWLVPALEGRKPLFGDDGVLGAWRRAHISLREWDAAIQKPSCYASWPYARDYQVHMRAWLEREFTEALQGRIRSRLDASELLERIRIEHGLPEVKHPALPLMLAYLAEQTGRIDAIAQGLVVAEEQDLEELRAFADGPWSDRLRAEANNPINASAVLTKIYRWALNGGSDVA